MRACIARYESGSLEEPRFVTFESLASNLVGGDTNSMRDVCVRDRLSGVTTRVSVGLGGVQGDATNSDASIGAGTGRV